MSRGALSRAIQFLFTKTAQIGYCKLPNGTLICWDKVTFSATSTGVQKVSKAFPHAFSVAPYVVASWNDTINTPNYMDYVYECSETNASTCVLAAKRLSAQSAWYANYIAIGRWK